MTLASVFLGSLARRRGSTLFSFAAIVLGVALGMAVHVVHDAALSEFARGIRSLVGEAELQVVGPKGGFNDDVYALLAARPEVSEISPVIEVDAKLSEREETLQLYGIDVFQLARVTPILLPRPAIASDSVSTLADDGIFLSAAAQTAFGTKPGDILRLQTASKTLDLRVKGDLPGVGEPRRLAVMDIAAVQAYFGKIGRLTRLDLRLDEGVSPTKAREELQAILPAGLLIEIPEIVADQAANMSRAYRANLTMLAAIALLTGVFLVFSAQALSVARRRKEFAFLRAVGLVRRTLFGWLVVEGAVVGLAGGVIGVALGHGMAWGVLALLGGDLGANYFPGLKPQMLFQPQASTIYVILGLCAGVSGAWFPAREAAMLSPAQALKASDEALLLAGRGHPKLGMVVLIFSILACRIPPFHSLPIGGYLAVACLLVGSVMLLPAVASEIVRLIPVRCAVPVRLAAARLGSAPGHAVVAAAGVLTSFALVAAMAIMVASFRDSVDQWLVNILPADLYLRAGKAQGGIYIDDALQRKISLFPGVGRVEFTRHDTVRLANGEVPVAVIARPVSENGRELPLIGSVATVGKPVIWISEAMQDLYGWRVGQRVELPLAGRLVSMNVAGVWRDYIRQSGAVMIDLDDYRYLTGDRLADDAAIHLATGAIARQVAEALAVTDGIGALEIVFPADIRAISLHIFDRTFAVTYLLETVAVAIGLAGVAASFAALAAARRQEFGMLRHLGMARCQIGWLLAIEGALVAGVGVIVGLLAGGAIGLVLIEVVNRQSFHWSMDLHIPWVSLAVVALSLVVLAALAAVVAGSHAMRQNVVLAVREDW